MNKNQEMNENDLEYVLLVNNVENLIKSGLLSDVNKNEMFSYLSRIKQKYSTIA
jgi:hypothetical protein